MCYLSDVTKCGAEGPDGRDSGVRSVTLPNIITIFRFLLVPAVILALLTEKMGWAFAGFLIAGISDGVDGFIARQFDQRSELGAYLDPMADKVLLVSVFVMLGYMGHLPLWLVVMVVSRDALIVSAVLLSTIMGNPVEMKPLMVSKLNTLMQIVLVLAILAAAAFRVEISLIEDALIYVTAGLTVASTAAYLVGWLKHMNGYGERDNINP